VEPTAVDVTAALGPA